RAAAAPPLRDPCIFPAARVRAAHGEPRRAGGQHRSHRMTSQPRQSPAQSGIHRQKGTPVADRALHTLSDTATDPAQNAVDEPTQRIPRALIDNLDTPPGSAIEDAPRE